jgi:hypothetical protein
MMSMLDDMGAEKTQFYVMRNREGDSTQDKLRVTFWVRDKEPSIKIYKYFNENKLIMDESARVNIFLQKSEEIFVKYGEIEAEKYK